MFITRLCQSDKKTCDLQSRVTLIHNSINMKKYLLLVLFFLFAAQWGTAQTGTLQGKITDSQSNEPLIGATIKLFRNGVFITGTQTDLDGNYNLPTEPDTYDVEMTYIGYAGVKTAGIVIKPNTTTFLDKAIEEDGGVELEGVIIKVERYKVPLIEKDPIVSRCYSAEDLLEILKTSTEEEPQDQPAVYTKNTLHVYPNPIQSTFYIELPDEFLDSGCHIQIIDIKGSILYENTYKQPSKIIPMNIASFIAGVYSVKVYEGDRSYIKKIIKI